jgi:hypothetical protein
MPSSISNSDRSKSELAGSAFRATASDRPGVAQPVPERDIPAQPWGRAFIGMLVLFAALLGAWEWHWRDFGAKPGSVNSFGLWAAQRRRIDAGEGNATVLIGASRILFDVQLPQWESLAGQRPIQLALQGTSPLSFMEDLAADPHFTGRLVIGVAPDVFFPGRAYRGAALGFFRKETPAQRVGQWLSLHFIETYFAFDDPDFALAAVLARLPWPERPGKRWRTDVRKLAVTRADRNTHIWDKVENDADYREITRNIWRENFVIDEDAPPLAVQHKRWQEQIDRATRAAAILRDRGVKMLFVRAPSSGPYLEFENRTYPRDQTWDRLLLQSGVPGIHFEDYPQMQHYTLPEWSHLTADDAERFTADLYRVIEQDFWPRQKP